MRNLRLEKISEMVMKGVICADIGTDHALLPVMLISQGICPKVYACDVAEGPLESAERTVKAAGMADRIPLILSDGFENVPADAECAVLAGMGFYTAAGILERAYGRLSSFRQIIVEVNRNVREMRAWISGHGFTISDEAQVHERGFDYIIISFHTEKHAPYSEAELECGPVLMRKKDRGYADYCRRQYEAAEAILAKQTRKTENTEKIRRRAALWKAAADHCEEEQAG